MPSMTPRDPKDREWMPDAAARAVESTAHPSFATDEEGRILAWNPAAERLLGYREAEVLGRRCHDFLTGLHTPEQPLSRESWRHLAHRGEAVVPFEARFRSAYKRLLPVEVSIVALPDETQRGTDFLHLLRLLDVPDRRPATPRPSAQDAVAIPKVRPLRRASSG